MKYLCILLYNTHYNKLKNWFTCSTYTSDCDKWQQCKRGSLSHIDRFLQCGKPKTTKLLPCLFNILLYLVVVYSVYYYFSSMRQWISNFVKILRKWWLDKNNLPLVVVSCHDRSINGETIINTLTKLISLEMFGYYFWKSDISLYVYNCHGSSMYDPNLLVNLI